ncbi:MAG: hypothetical protein JXA94_05750 [Parachlamydiales bacterium]|nr:hypothetical protein [Parachlamydiales bacterium]
MNMFSPESPEESEESYTPTDHEIEKVTSDPESIAYGLFSTLSNYQDHYNNIQKKYKALTITWVIATFIGLGYLISGYEEALHGNVMLLITFFSFLAAAGVSLLRFLDTGVYQALIRSIFKELLILEKKYPIIGSSHQNMINLFKNKKKKTELLHGVFYAYFILFFLLIGIVCLSIYLFSINTLLAIIVLASIIIILISSYFFLKRASVR